MKERPILFSAPMVRALLVGTKTQTRRIVGERQRLGYPHGEINRMTPHGFEVGVDVGFRMACPHGVVGDRLWVREAWRSTPQWDRCPPREISHRSRVAYEVDGHVKMGRYRHARFMPRWASRLTLEIVDVRVQRLHEISEVDARAEGVTAAGPAIAAFGEVAARSAYMHLWEDINGEGAWQRNPWVFALTFKRVEAM